VNDPLPSPHSPWFIVLLGSLGGVIAAGALLVIVGSRLTQLDNTINDVADIRVNGTRVTQADHALIVANLHELEELERARLTGAVADQAFQSDLTELKRTVLVLFTFKDTTDAWKLTTVDRLSRTEALVSACR
jgi:hypothetical protein